MAILSGFPETDKLDLPTPGPYGCDDGYSLKAENCWPNVNSYLNCGTDVGANPDCEENGPPPKQNRYINASPYLGFESVADNPPIYIMNAGGTPEGDDTPNFDLSALQEALDLRDRLDEELGFDEGIDYKLCIVDTSGHATGPLDNRHCRSNPDIPGQGGDETIGYENRLVYESLAKFLKERLDALP